MRTVSFRVVVAFFCVSATDVQTTGDIAVEAFTCLLVFKNIFSFGLTWSSYDWLVAYGIKPIFNAVASVQLVICLLTVPMCKFLCLSVRRHAPLRCSLLTQ